MISLVYSVGEFVGAVSVYSTCVSFSPKNQ